MMSSLRTRLLLGLAILIAVTGIAASAFAYMWAFDEANELQDAALLQIGSLAITNRIADNPDPTGVDAEARVFIRDLPAAASRDPLTPALPTSLLDGLQTITQGTDSWRVLVRTRPDGGRVAIVQSTAARDEIASDSALRTIIPLGFLFPCLVLLVGIVIRVTLEPLSLLAARLDASQTQHLERLPLEGVPSELKPFVGSINHLLERIAAMFEKQRRFVADAAHELRSPITALSVQASNLDQAGLSPQSQERLTTLRAGVRRTAHLLEQLLAFARYDNQDAVTLQPLSLDQATKEVVADFMPIAERRRIDLGVARLESAMVLAEATGIAMIVRNLLDNAIRHSPDGGAIDVDLAIEGHEAVLTITDSGSGILPDDIPRLFEPFFRGNRAIGEGTGLGLSISRQIAQSLKGTLELHNVEDPLATGCRAELRLPRTEH